MFGLNGLYAQVAKDTAVIKNIPVVAVECDSIENTAKPDFTVVAVGDIMLGTNYPSESYLPPRNNCYPLLSEVKPYLMDATVTFGNLEGVFSGNSGVAKTCKDTTNCYIFRMPEAYLDCIIDAGFDFLSMANNHVNDYGYEGRINTARHLAESGMAYAGLASKPYAIIERDGYKVGFAAFAPHTGTADMKDYEGAKRIVSMLNDSCDFVLVYFHGGAEGKDCQHVTRADEEFMEYNRGNVYRFAHDVVDAGADLVMGSGPHVTRAVEIYKNRLIGYSLGNFSTYSRFNLSGPNGFCPMIKTWLAADGSFVKAKITPIYQPGEGGAKIDPLKRAIFKIQELTRADFPDSPVIIFDDGWILEK
jgi:poly-gamma-glutamate capsule biosynthesis protein CapA/YwtB (metallophosphatase superfamily)